MNVSIRFRQAILAMVVAGAATISGSVLAQNEQGPASRLAERLSLSVEQQAEIAELMQAHRESRRATERGHRGERRQARAALRSEIRALLDDEQAQAFDQMGNRRADKRPGAHRGDRENRNQPGRHGGCGQRGDA